MVKTTKAELEAVAYGDFKAKYEELGILESFKAGKKKVWYIENALDLLKVKDASEDSDSSITTEEASAIVESNNESAKAEVIKKENSTFDEAVSKVISKKEFWNEVSMSKRIRQHQNIFLQHRNTEKGKNAIFQKEVLEEAFNQLYKS